MRIEARELPDLRLQILHNQTLPSYYLAVRAAHSAGQDTPAAEWVRVAMGSLADDPLHYVAEPFCELVRAAAPSLPTTTNFAQEDMPGPFGFMFFSLEFPLFSHLFEHPTTWAVQWVQTANGETWEPQGVMTWWFADKAATIASMPEVMRLTSDKTVEDVREMQFLINETGPPMMPMMTAEVKFGSQLSALEGVDKPGDPYWFFRYLVTTWNLQRQRVTRTTETYPPRATQRRMSREGYAADLAKVRVIDLGGSNSAGDGTGREYHHRWVVNGHWRNQWYPSLEDHRPVWISPYTKGPEDAPFLTGEKVYRWKKP